MSSGIATAHMASILDDEDFLLHTQRMRLVLARESAQQILELSAANDRSLKVFDAFALALTKKLEPQSPTGPTVSKARFTKARTQLWSRFHTVRTTDLEALWKDLLLKLGVKPEYAADPLLSQYVNEKLLESYVKSKFSVENEAGLGAEVTELIPDKCNALRYAVGYIPFKL